MKKVKDKTLEPLFNLLDKFSVCLQSLIKKLVKQKVVSVDELLKKLPNNVKNKLLLDLNMKEKVSKKSRSR